MSLPFAIHPVLWATRLASASPLYSKAFQPIPGATRPRVGIASEQNASLLPILNE